jgi:molecular chaperone IbpA
LTTSRNVRYLHRGIAPRAFEQRFSLADHIKVAGASLVNGMLHVDLVREVPEVMKPRKIAIATAARGNRKEGCLTDLFIQ